MLLTLDNKEYFVPQKWSQVSIESYQKLMQYVGDESDEYTKVITTIHALTKAPIEVLEKCKKSDIEKLSKAVSNLLNIKVNTTLNMLIEVDGVEYGFHPNLEEITFAEFIFPKAFFDVVEYLISSQSCGKYENLSGSSSK